MTCAALIAMTAICCTFAGFVLGGYCISHAYDQYDRKLDDQLKQQLKR